MLYVGALGMLCRGPFCVNYFCHKQPGRAFEYTLVLLAKSPGNWTNAVAPTPFSGSETVVNRYLEELCENHLSDEVFPRVFHTRGATQRPASSASDAIFFATLPPGRVDT